jgi:hypothetical protein
MTETASLHVAHDASFRHFFLWLIAPSPSKSNQFTPYHLFIYIKKNEYYVIKLNMFYDLFLHYILWRLGVLWRLSIYVTDRFFFSVNTNLNQ